MTTAGEQVGAAVDAAVQNAEAGAQDQIAAARADADRAAAEAKRIADAAISTELGGRIQAQGQEFATWRQATEQRMAEIAETSRQQGEKLTEATGLLGSIRALLVPPKEPTQPPTSQAGADPTGANSIKTEPNGSKEPVKAETPPAPPPKKRTFL